MKFNKQISINKKIINDENKTFIIAEAGINHNGSLLKAKKLIKIAKQCGADAIKFQNFKTEKLIKKNVKKPSYQNKNLKNKKLTQYNMLKKVELNFEETKKLINYCKKLNIEFISTPYDDESLSKLIKLNVTTIKIASTDLTNISFIKKIAKSKKNIILSTGMSYLHEIKQAVKEIKKYNKNLIILQCTSDYPTKDSEAGILLVKKFKNLFKCIIGFSDHTVGVGASPYAVCLGAKVIEKHFTLNKNDIGPDHKASLSPIELKNLVNQIRSVEKYLLLDVKAPTKSELNSRKYLQKHIVASKKILKGDLFTEKNLQCMRTGGIGLSASNYFKIIGKKSKRNFAKFQEIEN